MPEQFHFIQPLWLLALLPLAALVWLVSQHTDANNPWRKIVDRQLLPLLIGEEKTARTRTSLWLLTIGWLLTVLALANPTWEQQPQPVMQINTSRVIVLDLSRSMLAADLKPSRLARARFKLEDILTYDDEGQTGLVVFAGDAFSVTPLTRDIKTIRAQLRALEPAIMPSQGSRAGLGLLKAQELLQQAGVPSGQVLLIADGIEGEGAVKAAAQLQRDGYRVSVLGVGTPEGAPLPDGGGGITRDGAGKPVMVKLDSNALRSVAQAGGGRYTSLTSNNTDVRYLLDSGKGADEDHESSDLQTQKWKEQGPLLAVLLLPLAALAFRRGWLLSIVLCICTLGQPQPVMAFGWDDLWQRKDQQAARALQQGHYEQAAKLAEDPVQRGSAEYKKGDFQKALDAFKNTQGSDATYNRGNALARLGEYQDAITAYEEALRTQPGMEDAVANKAAVEELLKQQQQQQQQKPDDASDQQEQQDQQSGKDDSSSGEGKQSEQNQSAENNSAESAEGNNNNQSGEGQDNQFADANQKMDEGKPDAQEESGPDTNTAPETEKDESNQARAEENAQSPDTGETPAQAEELTSEEQLAAQQWLRRIPDDPGGLLRRKFLYQYRQRNQQPEDSRTQNW